MGKTSAEEAKRYIRTGKDSRTSAEDCTVVDVLMVSHAIVIDLCACIPNAGTKRYTGFSPAKAALHTDCYPIRWRCYAAPYVMGSMGLRKTIF